MKKLQASELVELLGIDSNWRMHQLSDGQRRRVQLMLGLIRLFKILFLDEITSGLDVCVREDFIEMVGQRIQRSQGDHFVCDSYF